MTSCQSIFDIFVHLNRRPKYRMGKLPLRVPKVSEHCSSSSCANLVRLICSPKKSANRFNKVDRLLASSTEPSIQNMVSSVYCNRGMPFGQLSVWYPFNRPCEHACIVHVASARTNNRGASGHPYLTPFCGLIHPPSRCPFTNIENA